MGRSSNLVMLPSTGKRKSYRCGDFSFFGADGQVYWENTVTGASGAMLPDRALKVARQLGKDLVSNNLENSACVDTRDRRELEDLMKYLEQLAKEEQERMPDRKALSSLLWLPG